ncbi:hypothetical protein AXX12_13000 [Anaerosporomusa subterranea]|uniref:Uncharacterized protein n=1 Tax=Anaerosporomusa subterranea TaxID=1794912 RepID=A0A154BM87_ANASB|nr:YjcQ family protein [Anaerosporomusa subterranea]KYZ75093.1 hypothetical protein AXX12_13000 [Anaerosporomusa subterranea]
MTTKERILLAIYREYRKGNSDMRRSVRHDGLQLDPGSFNQDIQSLQSEGLIRGAVLVRDRSKNYPDQVILNQVAVTHYGLHYLRRNLLAKTGE